MKNFFLIIVLLSTINLNSQGSSVKAKWGEFISTEIRYRTPHLIGFNTESIFIIRYEKKKSFIEKYNLNTLRLEKSVLLNLEFKGKKMSIDDSFMLGKYPLMNTGFYNKKSRTDYSFIQKINPTNLVVAKPVIVAKRTRPENKGRLFPRQNSSRISGGHSVLYKQISPDNSLISFITPDETEGSANFKGVLFDDKLAKAKEFNLKFPFKEDFVVTQAKLTNEGLFYFFGYSKEEVEEKGLLGTRTYEVLADRYLVVFDPDTQESEVLEIKLSNNREINMSTFKLLANGGIQVAGLTQKDGGGVDGTFAITFSAEFNETNNEVHVFENEFIRQTMTAKARKRLDKKNEKASKKGEKEEDANFYNYYVDHLVQNDNESTTMLAEQYYVQVVTYTHSNAQGQTTTTTTSTYYYKDIIVANFDKEGNFNWKTLIEKSQISTNDGGYYSSYLVVPNNNELNVIYNGSADEVDDGLNVPEKRGKLLKLRPKQFGLNALVSEEGDVNTSVIFEFDDENSIKLVPRVCSSINKNLVFLYAKGRKGNKLGTLKID